MKIAAIVPWKFNYERNCRHRSRFVITGKDYRAITGKVNSIKILLGKPSIADPTVGPPVLFDLLKLILGMSSLSTIYSEIGEAWSQIQRKDADLISMAAGWTSGETEISLDDLLFKAILNDPHNYNKWLYYNTDQQLVLRNNLPLIVLSSDFGSGKP